MWQKPLENCVVLAALCWHKYCPLSTYGPLLPLHLLLYLEKGFFMYCLCPTELNRSKLRIKGMTGDNALQPVGSRSLWNCCPLCCFFFLFHYGLNSPNERRGCLLWQWHQGWKTRDVMGDWGLSAISGGVQTVVMVQVCCLTPAFPFLPVPPPLPAGEPTGQQQLDASSSNGCQGPGAVTDSNPNENCSTCFSSLQKTGKPNGTLFSNPLRV